MKSGIFLLIIFALPLIAEAQADLSEQGEEQGKITVQGRVLDEKTQLPVKAELDIFFDSDFILDDARITNEGAYTETLSRYGWYILDISAPGYLSKTDTLWVVGDSRKVIVRDFYLRPIEAGLSVVLNNVYFYFGQTILKEDSYPALNAIADLFRANPQISVEIAGHTDNEGREGYNLMLSEGRARAVVDYLVKQGVDSSRIQARGYGETRPIDPGETKAAKARNRRVEFVVLEAGG